MDVVEIQCWIECQEPRDESDRCGDVSYRETVLCETRVNELKKIYNQLEVDTSLGVLV